MGFSRQEYWSGLPFPSPEDLPNPGIEPTESKNKGQAQVKNRGMLLTILDKDSCQHILGVRQLLAGSRGCPGGTDRGLKGNPSSRLGESLGLSSGAHASSSSTTPNSTCSLSHTGAISFRIPKAQSALTPKLYPQPPPPGPASGSPPSAKVTASFSSHLSPLGEGLQEQSSPGIFHCFPS